jgi:DNA-binding NarL/FixJ family response regulator
MPYASIRPTRSAATILLIDPHNEEREYWAQRLRTSSADSVVLEADTGEVGLSICRSQYVDCVVTELTLSDMSGFQLLIKLVPRPLSPDRAVIFLTNTLLLPMARLATNNGAQAYLVKTRISGDHLDLVIRNAINAVSVKQQALARSTSSSARTLLRQGDPNPLTRR